MFTPKYDLLRQRLKHMSHISNMWVDVSLEARELLRYPFRPDDRSRAHAQAFDFWKGLELRREDRKDWNLHWKRVGTDCVISLVRNGTVRLRSDLDWDSEPMEALRYSS